MNTPTAVPVIAMDEVVSSQIFAIGYAPELEKLAVRFKNKDGKPTSLYHYSNVPVTVFDELRDAESIGSHFYKHIKPYDVRYPHVCIEKMPPAPVDEQ
jgi:hypothetical protein